ncbi:hypothetical protein B0I37DRAFT_193202 [Chaetomium sp. MPI-CAGE-AT-0009]|nr:hypothetical protein B0I37DRAFT_193202 [Chaetomium sp. MPI-CAGE-AT-0009]
MKWTWRARGSGATSMWIQSGYGVDGELFRDGTKSPQSQPPDPRTSLPSSRTLDKRPSSRGLGGGAVEFFKLELCNNHAAHWPTPSAPHKVQLAQLGRLVRGVVLLNWDAELLMSGQRLPGKNRLGTVSSGSGVPDPQHSGPTQRPTTNSPLPTPREPRCDIQRLTTRGASDSITDYSVLRPLTAHVLQPPTTVSRSLSNLSSSRSPQQDAASGVDEAGLFWPPTA